MSLTVLHLDDETVAIDKPPGLLVHPSALDAREERTALKLLRDQLGQHLWPLHRLDKGTSGVLLFAAGACMVMVFAMLSSLVQLYAPNEMRGRVMSIYMVAFRGGMPLGSLAGGWMATVTSAPAVLIFNGVLISAVAAWFLLRSPGTREL